MTSRRVLVVDDHPIFREGLRTALDTDGIEVVGEATDGAEAVELAARLAPDVVLMDLQMPEQSGIDATRAITAGQPEIVVPGSPPANPAEIPLSRSRSTPSPVRSRIPRSAGGDPAWGS